MKCPVCGANKLVHDTRDMLYTYKGQQTVFPQVTGDYCGACEESILDFAETKRTMVLMLAFNKRVNLSLEDTSFTVAVRKKLNLDQREAAEIFGCGANAFFRYETGKTKPPISLVKLLRVLDQHPELLSEVRAS